MNGRLCSTTITEVPLATKASMARAIRSPSTGFTPPIGSSRITSSGAAIRMRANSTSRFWPPLKLPARSLRRALRPNSWRISRACTSSSSALTRCARPRPRKPPKKPSRSGSHRAITTFSSTLSPGHSRGDWNVRTSPRREMRWGGRPWIALPLKSTVPLSGSLKPDMRSIAVLLPAPFGPMRPVTCPSGALNEHASTAITPPNRFVSPLTSRTGPATGSFTRSVERCRWQAARGGGRRIRAQWSDVGGRLRGLVVGESALRQQALWPEAEEENEDQTDESSTQREQDLRMEGVQLAEARQIRQESRRLLHEEAHDQHAQGHAPDVAAAAHQHSGVQDDHLDRRPGRRIERGQVRGEKRPGEAAQGSAEQVALQLQPVDIPPERSRGTLVLTQRPQSHAEAAARDAGHQEVDQDEHHQTQPQEEVLVGEVIQAEPITHRVHQPPQSVVSVE